MRLILLPRINGVIWNENADRGKPRHIGKAVVGDAKKRQRVIAKLKYARAVDLVLFAVLQSLQKPVAVGDLCQNPGMSVGAETSDQVEVLIVASQCEERIKLRTQSVGRGKILRMIAFAHIEGTAVHQDAADGLRDENVGVRVAVAVGVGGKIVGNQIASDLKVRGDGFAVIPGDARREILRSLDSARGSFDRQA